MGLKKILAVCAAGVFLFFTIKRLLFNPMALLAAHAPPPTSVQVATITTQPMDVMIESIGSLISKDEVILAPEVAGRVLSLPFKSGTSVKEGDIITQLDDSVEQAELKKAQAQLKLAQLSLERAQSLVSKKVESQSILDQKKADFQQAEAAVVLAKVHVKQRQVMAPFDGDLGIFDNKINIGHYVQPGQPLVSLTKRDHVYLNFSLDEKKRPHIKVGQDVLITTDTYGDKVFKGTITSIDPQIKQETRGIMVQASIENNNLMLFPGMYAHVKVLTHTKPNVILIPETAINYTLYGHSVFVVKDDKGDLTVKRQNIHVGQRVRQAVEVTDGLKAGDVIITIGHANLLDGAKVIVDKDHTLPELKNLKS